MSFYSDMAATAADMIGDFGRSATLVKLSRTAADSDQPWLGVDTSETTRSVNAVFLAVGGTGLTVVQPGERSPRDAELHALVAANDLQSGDEVETFDELRDGSDVWGITRVEVLQPGATRLLYDLTLEAKA